MLERHIDHQPLPRHQLEPQRRRHHPHGGAVGRAVSGRDHETWGWRSLQGTPPARCRRRHRRGGAARPTSTAARGRARRLPVRRSVIQTPGQIQSRPGQRRRPQVDRQGPHLGTTSLLNRFHNGFTSMAKFSGPTHTTRAGCSHDDSLICVATRSPPSRSPHRSGQLGQFSCSLSPCAVWRLLMRTVLTVLPAPLWGNCPGAWSDRPLGVDGEHDALAVLAAAELLDGVAARGQLTAEGGAVPRLLAGLDAPPS